MGGKKGLKLALRDPNPFQQLTVTFLYKSGVVVPSCRNLDQRHLFLNAGLKLLKKKKTFKNAVVSLFCEGVSLLLQPIRIANLPANVTVHEDYDDRKLLRTIYISDGNAADQDNVTCYVSENPDPMLIELVHDGNHAYDCKNIPLKYTFVRDVQL